jgi:hypothetical protein
MNVAPMYPSIEMPSASDDSFNCTAQRRSPHERWRNTTQSNLQWRFAIVVVAELVEHLAKVRLHADLAHAHHALAVVNDGAAKQRERIGEALFGRVRVTRRRRRLAHRVRLAVERRLEQRDTGNGVTLERRQTLASANLNRSDFADYQFAVGGNLVACLQKHEIVDDNLVDEDRRHSAVAKHAILHTRRCKLQFLKRLLARESAGYTRTSVGDARRRKHRLTSVRSQRDSLFIFRVRRHKRREKHRCEDAHSLVPLGVAVSAHRRNTRESSANRERLPVNAPEER